MCCPRVWWMVLQTRDSRTDLSRCKPVLNNRTASHAVHTWWGSAWPSVEGRGHQWLSVTTRLVRRRHTDSVFVGVARLQLLLLHLILSWLGRYLSTGVGLFHCFLVMNWTDSMFDFTLVTTYMISSCTAMVFCRVSWRAVACTVILRTIVNVCGTVCQNEPHYPLYRFTSANLMWKTGS